MTELSWCKKQQKGIKFIEPNDNLSNRYYAEAEESLLALRAVDNINSNTWRATTKYYARYLGLYSVLMKIGVKCEIHDCTIVLAWLLEREGLLPQGMAESIEKYKAVRIANQYYSEDLPVEVNFDDEASFLILIKGLLNKLDAELINYLRNKIKGK